MATFHPFRFLRNAAIIVGAAGLAYLGFLWWHQDQVGLDRRVVNTSLTMPTSPRPVTGWKLERVNVDRTFRNLTRLIQAHDGNLYVLEQRGRIYRLPESLDSGSPEEFVRLDNVNSTGEGGLLGFALHPDYGDIDSPNGRYAYLYYSADKEDGGRSNRLSRFTAKRSLKKLDPDSELILIDQDDEDFWHDGGAMAFGPDGFLYLGLGDEGQAHDRLNNSQTISKDFFSGVLRIDVNNTGGSVSHQPERQPDTGTTANYMIPNDNPFVGVPGALEEFYALGLRNPHDLHFDQSTGRGFLTDVGQDHQEELNLLTKGSNYQWSFREGLRPARKGPHEGGKLPANLVGTSTPPLLAYDHASGNKCIIGGFVYRGDVHPELEGRYIFGDLTSGRVWAASFADDDPNSLDERELIAHLDSTEARSLCALTADDQGEIYAATLAGHLYHLKARDEADHRVDLPSRLSETGVFADVSTLEPAPGFIPYEVNAPLWSDGAHKRRWICVPGDGTDPVAGNDRILLKEDGPWEFPSGTCFVKHFELPLDENDSTKVKRLETRIIMRDDRHGIYGVTYRWNEDGSDAILLDDAAAETLPIMCVDGSTRSQQWDYPSRIDCLSCHTEEAGFVLGVNTRQLNRWVDYPETGRSGHQLRTWNGIDLITRSKDSIRTVRPTAFFGYDALVDPADSSASLNDRMMSYLDSNCGHCHRPFMMRTALDLRWGVDEIERHLLEQEAINPMAGTATLLVDRENPDSSEMLKRVTTEEGGFRMPPLASRVPDPQAIELIRQWIESKAGQELP